MEKFGLSDSINRYYIDTAWDYKYLWITKAFALHFGYYDQKAKRHKDALLRMNEVMVESASIKDREKILDAGCGLGGSSIWLAKNKNCQVTGTNIVNSQIRQAKENAKNEGVEYKVNFIQADYATLPIQDETYDVFWALESIVHAPDKKAVIREAFRILNNGGRIVMTEYLLRENPELNESEGKYLTPWLNGWSMPSLETLSNYRKYLEQAGFTDVASININKNISPSLKRLKFLCNLALPGAMLMESLGLFTHQRVDNIKGSLRQISAFEKGYWNYFIITANKPMG